MYRFAHRCFNDAILSVEIHWKGKLVTSFFPRPSVGNNLEEEAKQALRQNIDISTEEDQQKDFVKRARLLHAEMVHFTDLQSVNVPFTDTSIYDMIISRLDMCRQLGFGLAVIINIITLTCVRVPEGGTSSVPLRHHRHPCARGLLDVPLAAAAGAAAGEARAAELPGPPA